MARWYHEADRLRPVAALGSGTLPRVVTREIRPSAELLSRTHSRLRERALVRAAEVAGVRYLERRGGRAGSRASKCSARTSSAGRPPIGLRLLRKTAGEIPEHA